MQVRTIESDSGIYDTKLLKEAIMPEGVQRARTSLICLENSFHLNRGLAVKRSDYEETVKVAQERNIPLFMDGARIFNSAAALNVDVKDLLDCCDSVAFCLTKGLAAPIGSILAGKKDFIYEARRVKQRLGGGWRQAGVIAAPSIIALTEMVKRLPEDHENAERIRTGLEEMGITVDRGGVMTNIVNADLSPLGLDAPSIAERLNQLDIKVKVCSESTLRLVTHNDISQQDVDFVLEKMGEIVSPHS